MCTQMAEMAVCDFGVRRGTVVLLLGSVRPQSQKIWILLLEQTV